MSTEHRQFCGVCRDETPHEGARCCRCTPDRYAFAITPTQAELIKRKLAEIPQKEGEDTTDYLLRLTWVMAGRSGEPRGAERKRIVRKLRTLREKGTIPVDGRSTRDANEDSLRFIETILAKTGGFSINGVPELARRDLSYLAKYPEESRYARMPKPWKGRKGREAAKGMGTTTNRKFTIEQRAIELHRQGHTKAQIGEMIDRDQRSVRRYLNGR